MTENPPPTRMPPSSGSITQSFFETPECLNCGSALTQAYCGACGQKKASRLGAGHLREEAWEKLRWFEADLARSAIKVAMRPGKVAREYVLGQRKSHTHPLKLLLAAIVILLLVIARTDYLGSSDETLSKAVQLVQSYSKWSFSLGILAIFIASSLAFWRRQGFNAVEHLVLATYVHFVIIVASIINLSPLLLGSDPQRVTAHRAWSAHYMGWVEVMIVFFAFREFFAVPWKRWWLPAIGAAIFYVVKEGLFYLYARLVIRIVVAQLT